MLFSFGLCALSVVVDPPVRTILSYKNLFRAAAPSTQPRSKDFEASVLTFGKWKKANVLHASKKYAFGQNSLKTGSIRRSYPPINSCTYTINHSDYLLIECGADPARSVQAAGRPGSTQAPTRGRNRPAHSAGRGDAAGRLLSSPASAIAVRRNLNGVVPAQLRKARV